MSKVEEFYLLFDHSENLFKIIDESKNLHKKHKDPFYLIKSFLKKYKNDLREYFFRGQYISDFPLANIFRDENVKMLSNEDAYYNEVKSNHFNEFTSRIDLSNNNELELYSKMQHYSLPTRFLDITENFYKAILFIIFDLEKHAFEIKSRKNEDGKLEYNWPAIFVFKLKNENNFFYTYQKNKIKNTSVFPIIVPVKDPKNNQRAIDQDSLFIYFKINKEVKEKERIQEHFLKTYDLIKLEIRLSEKKHWQIIEKRLKEFYYTKNGLFNDMFVKRSYYIEKYSKS